jgi:multisubunit Na+/H+ antiporter MnhE subunit
MVLWVWVDDSLDTPELLVGAAVAAMGALLTELVLYQAAIPLRARIEWLSPLPTIPLRVVRDLGVVFGALWRRIVRGELPPSTFEEVRVQAPGETAEAVTRRVLIVAIDSVAPNSFALGIDTETQTMIVHRLVGTGERGASG